MLLGNLFPFLLSSFPSHFPPGWMGFTLRLVPRDKCLGKQHPHVCHFDKDALSYPQGYRVAWEDQSCRHFSFIRLSSQLGEQSKLWFHCRLVTSNLDLWEIQSPRLSIKVNLLSRYPSEIWYLQTGLTAPWNSEAPLRRIRLWGFGGRGDVSVTADTQS